MPRSVTQAVSIANKNDSMATVAEVEHGDYFQCNLIMIKAQNYVRLYKNLCYDIALEKKNWNDNHHKSM